MPWTLRYAETTCAAQTTESDERQVQEFAFPADADANVEMEGAMIPASLVKAMGVGSE